MDLLDIYILVIGGFIGFALAITIVLVIAVIYIERRYNVETSVRRKENGSN